MNNSFKKIFPHTLAATFLFVSIFQASLAGAQEYSSTNFKVLNPVQTSGGGYSSSVDYRLDSSISQIGIGTSSAAGFNVNAGFLYFPYVTTPIVSATAGTNQVSLSWTAASGVLGWTASGYNLGYSTVSGGPYTFGSSLGNVLSTTQTGLTSGTTYYFVVRVEDAYGNIIATSTESSAVPTAPVTPPSGGGGGGGGGGFFSTTAIVFSGEAYPKSKVTLLKDGQILSTTVAETNASFRITAIMTAGNYIFSMYTEDSNGNKSATVALPENVSYGVTTNVAGIILPPTIYADKSEVKKGDNIKIFGQSAPLADIVISVYSNKESFSKTTSDKDGKYSYDFDTSVLDLGMHTTKSKASIGNLVSGFSNFVNFKVGTQNIEAAPFSKCPVKGDLNNDCKVNLVDFSIASYWYKRTLSENFKKIEIERLNGDGKVSLVDFSIMSFYWTG